MRASLTFGLIVCALIAATWVAAQPRDETRVAKDPEATNAKTPKPAQPKTATAEKPAVALPSRAVLAKLQLEIDAVPFQERLKFKDVLNLLSDKLQAGDRAVAIELNLDAFQEITGVDAPNPLEEEVLFTSNRKRVTVLDVLNQTTRQLARTSSPGTLVIRAGRVDIVPSAFASKEYLLNQTFRADFKDQRLDAALEELSDMTGVSIVVDARARQKAQTTVSARFNDDVAVQDAVRMLTDMADLKMVYLVTGIYVTTPEHAVVMQKDLLRAYGIPDPATPGPAPLGPLMVPQLGEPPPEPSPLMPPLPPNRGKRRDQVGA